MVPLSTLLQTTLLVVDLNFGYANGFRQHGCGRGGQKTPDKDEATVAAVVAIVIIGNILEEIGIYAYIIEIINVNVTRLIAHIGQLMKGCRLQLLCGFSQ